ncbi:histidine kinase internal region [Paenibacillus algicola]|uniref:histidine kinase n=1 Tax=Paenibacillus algicola TaxID=2565926 RepID=A0A4P8XGD7_9BACL|nr:sensor histidine kinase [Paenibacillus algicola]QCT01512.1 histidine kinase internal region [Paenibacillus algicola]
MNTKQLKIYNILTKLGLTRTRVQLFMCFVFIMILILWIAGWLTYHTTLPIIERNTVRIVENSAAQTQKHVEALFGETNTISLQFTMDSRVQDILEQASQNAEIGISDKLNVRPIIIKYTAFSQNIHSIDIYSEKGSLYPVESLALQARIGSTAYNQLKQSAGEAIWLGADPLDSNYLLSVRRIRLQHNGQFAGYLVVRTFNTVLTQVRTEQSSEELLLLFDQQDRLVYTSMEPISSIEMEELKGKETVLIRNRSYKPVIKSSNMTGWSLVILTPMDQITAAIHALKKSLLWSGLVTGVLLIILSLILSSKMIQSLYSIRKIMHKARNGKPMINDKIYFNKEVNELNQSYNKMAADIDQLIHTVYEKEIYRSQSELKALHAQIHPHFLYNTLEVVNWMLREKGQDDSADVIVDLSQLFRYSIKAPEWVALKDEVDHVRSYLRIMQLRIKRLEFNLIQDPEVSECIIPKLILQPIIENAIKYGIEPMRKQCILTIIIEKQNAELKEDAEPEELLVIKIHDNGKGINEDKLAQIRSSLYDTNINLFNGESGIGLTNVHHRLQSLYGHRYGLEINSKADEGTCVSIVIPLNKFK